MFGRKTMSIEEARSILGVDAQCTLEDVMGRYAKMFEANEKNGSFYLQSKIHRAKERMEAEFLGEGGGGDGGGGGGGGEGEGGGGDGADAAGDAAKNPNAGRGFAASGVDEAPKK
jgi:import inner membrane translocase subunit TIM16